MMSLCRHLFFSCHGLQTAVVSPSKAVVSSIIEAKFREHRSNLVWPLKNTVKKTIWKCYPVTMLCNVVSYYYGSVNYISLFASSQYQVSSHASLLGNDIWRSSQAAASSLFLMLHCLGATDSTLKFMALIAFAFTVEGLHFLFSGLLSKGISVLLATSFYVNNPLNSPIGNKRLSSVIINLS